ncbi:MAG: phenylacetate-CoA oxygenase subunit PaaJ [Arenicella sp.]|nr:phenylacetate-CoA oxygenase subunit PaaJ [Arenicella sp.]
MQSQEQVKLLEILSSVADPEIPVLSIDEMGILRGVAIEHGRVKVTITPTYSGCPAIDQIAQDVSTVLADNGYPESEVLLVLSPAWTTDWMSDESKQKLRDYGIAPPCRTTDLSQSSEEQRLLFTAPCPQCRSLNTQIISQFGSTACKALWKCNQCKEPFDYFKPI